MAEHTSANTPTSDSEVQPGPSTDAKNISNNEGLNVKVGDSYLREFESLSAAICGDPLYYIDPKYHEAATVDKYGIVTWDHEKLENIQLFGRAQADPEEEERLRKRVLEQSKKIEEEFTAPATDETETDSSDEELEKEEFTEFKYEKKNKLWNRKAHLRQMIQAERSFYTSKIKFIEGGVERFSEDLTDYIELDLHYAVNILRLIAYPKLCKKHFSPEFPSGAFAEDDKNISISVEHIEFLLEELPIDFLELVQSENFSTVASDWESDSKINNIMPSFIQFLKSDSAFQFHEECITIILAILKNPYRKLDFYFDDKLPLVKEQISIAEYLVGCLQISGISKRKVWDKYVEAIISFAKIHSTFLALIVTGFDNVLSTLKGKRDYDIYCRISVIMSSYGASLIDLCLPQHF